MIFILPLPLQFQSPGDTASFVANCLLWLFFLSPFSEFYANCEGKPSFSAPVDPFSEPLLAYSHSLVSTPSTKKSFLTRNSSGNTWQNLRNISYQATLQPACFPNNQRGQQKPRKRTHIQQTQDKI